MNVAGKGSPSPDSHEGAPVQKTQAPRQDSRRARTNEKLVPAVLNQLAEYGYTGFTIDRLSAQSGVAKTTIYRRWTSKAELIFDLMFHQPTQEVPVNGNTLAEDIHILATHAVNLLASPTGRTVFPGLLADTAADPALAGRLDKEFIAPVRRTIEQMFARAIERGEVTIIPDVQVFHATLLGIPYAALYLMDDSDSLAITRQLEKQLLIMAMEASRDNHGQDVRSTINAGAET